MDLVEFYYEAEIYLRHEDVEANRGEVNAVDCKRPSREGSNKGKGKRKMDDDFEGSKRQRKEPKFSSFAGLNKTPSGFTSISGVDPLSKTSKERAH